MSPLPCQVTYPCVGRSVCLSVPQGQCRRMHLGGFEGRAPVLKGLRREGPAGEGADESALSQFLSQSECASVSWRPGSSSEGTLSTQEAPRGLSCSSQPSPLSHPPAPREGFRKPQRTPSSPCGATWGQ